MGLVAGDGGAVIWAQLVGYARAKEYLLTGKMMPAAEMERIGLVNAVVPPEELDARVYDLADELANAILLSTWKNRTIDLPMDSAEYQAELDHRINTSTFVKKPHTPKHAVTDDFAKSFK